MSAHVEQDEAVQIGLPQKSRRLEAVGRMDLDAATPQDASSHVAGRLVTVNEENSLPSKIRTATRRWTKHGKLPELERAFRGKQTCADCDPGEADSQERNRKSPDRRRGFWVIIAPRAPKPEKAVNDAVQTGLPLSSRRTSVSVPFTTSRARTRSASPCLIFEPVRAISSPLLKLTPMSSRKDFGHRYTSNVSVPVFTSRWAASFSLPFGGSFTSSTVAFILVSVCRSYFGGFDFASFCAITA